MSHDVYVRADALYKRGRYKDAAPLYRAAAESGDTAAALMMGFLYHTGHGVTRDTEEALRWYERAAAQGSLAAHHYLATIYGSKADHTTAHEWLEKAAARDYGPALQRLGWMYEKGQGVPVDLDRAMRYYERAAQQGHLFAERKIAGEMLRGRRGLARIPLGLFLLLRGLFVLIGIGLTSPASDRIRK